MREKDREKIEENNNIKPDFKLILEEWLFINSIDFMYGYIKIMTKIPTNSK